MAEIEIAILQRNALSRRLEDEAALRRQVSAVETERNQQRRGIAWQFTSRDARGKLERLYPVKEPSSEGREKQRDYCPMPDAVEERQGQRPTAALAGCAHQVGDGCEVIPVKAVTAPEQESEEGNTEYREVIHR